MVKLLASGIDNLAYNIGWNVKRLAGRADTRALGFVTLAALELLVVPWVMSAKKNGAGRGEA